MRIRFSCFLIGLNVLDLGYQPMAIFFNHLQRLKSTGVETGRVKLDRETVKKKTFFLKKDKTLTLPSLFLDELGINAHASLFTVSRFYTRRIKRLSR